MEASAGSPVKDWRQVLEQMDTLIATGSARAWGGELRQRVT